MKFHKLISLILVLVSMFSCSTSKTKNAVFFDTSFLGARLDSIVKLDDDTFEAFINPAFEPVNKSPWFAFNVSSDTPRIIEIKLNYGAYKHRYIPKLSTDKKTWRKIAFNFLVIDSLSGSATISLEVSPQKLYVSAQEIESSKDTNVWMDNLIKDNPELEKVTAGKTVLKNDNYCLKFENKKNKNAVVLIARQHPPEIPGGTIGFKTFFEELISANKTAKRFRENYNIYAFPLLNPDGADLGNWRHNANGVDLNRDWIDFTQPETQMVKSFINTKVREGYEVKFVLDFHTSYSGPYMLVLDSINTVKSKGIIPSWIKSIELNSSFKVEARRRSQDLPYCYNYFFNEFGSEAVTYEEGDEVDRDIIKKRAKVYAKEFMKIMLLKHDKNEL